MTVFLDRVLAGGELDFSAVRTLLLARGPVARLPIAKFLERMHADADATVLAIAEEGALVTFVATAPVQWHVSGPGTIKFTGASSAVFRLSLSSAPTS